MCTPPAAPLKSLGLQRFVANARGRIADRAEAERHEHVCGVKGIAKGIHRAWRQLVPLLAQDELLERRMALEGLGDKDSTCRPWQ